MHNENDINWNGLTLAEWLEQVDKEVYKLAGVSVHDLSDWLAYDCWFDGSTPQEGAIQAIESDDTFCDILEDL